MSICSTLLSFAKQREKAYALTKTMNGKKAQAITRIFRIAEHFRGSKEEMAAVRQLKDDLLVILPSEQSRYTVMRTKILNLIQITNER